jgi:hypothetical protein
MRAWPRSRPTLTAAQCCMRKAYREAVDATTLIAHMLKALIGARS